MKRKWQIIIALFLSLVTLITVAVPVLAQDGEPVEAECSFRGALAIIALWSVPAGKEFTARVFLRADQEPFPGAGVWLVSGDAFETLKETLGRIKQDPNQTATDTDYEGLMDTHGMYLGRTGEDGRLICTIERAGRYVLVAARNGYLPGFTRIGIRDIINALGIRAPKRTPVGQPVSIGVFERITHNPVEGAGVWAVSRDNVEALQQEAQSLKEDTNLTAEEKDYGAIVGVYGEFLGRTGPDGTLEHTFDETGGYLLVAVLGGYFPGFAPLAVVDRPDALIIKATPRRTYVGRDVELDVFARWTGDPVEGAGVWAISRDAAEVLRQDLAALREEGTAAVEKDYEAIVSLHGTLLGRTGPDGKLIASFEEAGVYVLVAVKNGYIPGFTVVVVREVPQPRTDASESQVVPDVLEPSAVQVR